MCGVLALKFEADDPSSVDDVVLDMTPISSFDESGFVTSKEEVRRLLYIVD